MYSSIQENCWRKRSPLETGLILLLIVAVPFLVMIVIAYLASVFQKYPDYSTLCAEFCAKSNSRAFNIDSVNPDVFNNSDNEYFVCPEKIFAKIKDTDNFKFIAALLEDVYEDDTIEQRFLCTAVIVNPLWVVVAANCIYHKNSSNINVLYVRSGSEFWSRDGDVRKVRTAITHQRVIAALELSFAFPTTSSIKPIAFTKKSLFKQYGIAEMYFWPSNDSAPLSRRQKYAALQVHPGVILTSNECTNNSKLNENTYCVTSMVSNFQCDYYFGFILLQRKKLMGFDVGGYCDPKYKTTMFMVYDVSGVVDWLSETIGHINIV